MRKCHRKTVPWSLINILLFVLKIQTAKTAWMSFQIMFLIVLKRSERYYITYNQLHRNFRNKWPQWTGILTFMQFEGACTLLCFYTCTCIHLNKTCIRFKTRNVSVIYFSLIVKQAIICLCKSRSNPFLEPTSTKQWE